MAQTSLKIVENERPRTPQEFLAEVEAVFGPRCQVVEFGPAADHEPPCVRRKPTDRVVRLHG